MQGLRKQLSKEALGRDLSARLDRTPSLPRSPQRRNINVGFQSRLWLIMQRLIDLNPYDQTSASSRKSAVAHSSRFEVDNIVMEECARGISSFVDRLEGQLKQALADGDQAVVLTRSAGKDRDWVNISSHVGVTTKSSRNYPKSSGCRLKSIERKGTKICSSSN